jgi:small subunit ribosomal protein S9
MPPNNRRTCPLPEIPVINATGRRKTAVARVRLKPGTGQIVVNGRQMVDYFPREVLHMRIQTPFEVVGAEGRWDVAARIAGGGPAGQADALRHGIARALEKTDESLRPSLKRSGLLTRDARKKERKKYGQKGARARYQFSKR